MFRHGTEFIGETVDGRIAQGVIGTSSSSTKRKRHIRGVRAKWTTIVLPSSRISDSERLRIWNFSITAIFARSRVPGILPGKFNSPQLYGTCDGLFIYTTVTNHLSRDALISKPR